MPEPKTGSQVRDSRLRTGRGRSSLKSSPECPVLGAKLAFECPSENDAGRQQMAGHCHRYRRVVRLAAARARGVKLGVAGPANLKPNIEARRQAADAFAKSLSNVINGMKAAGLSQRAMVGELNQLNVETARGGQWSLTQLQRVLARTATP